MKGWRGGRSVCEGVKGEGCGGVGGVCVRG